MICTEGSVKGCYELAWMMYDSGADDLELSRARFLFTETCAAGIFEACLQAADMRRTGEGGRQDEAGAARLYALACDAGQEAGCLMAPQTDAASDAPSEEGAPEAEASEEAAPQEMDAAEDTPLAEAPSN